VRLEIVALEELHRMGGHHRQPSLPASATLRRNQRLACG
jgi:hypothetical protein